MFCFGTEIGTENRGFSLVLENVTTILQHIVFFLICGLYTMKRIDNVNIQFHASITEMCDSHDRSHRTLLALECLHFLLFMH